MIVAMLLASLAATQGTFEGTVTGTMTVDGRATPFKYAQLGQRVRHELQLDASSAIAIYDGASGDMTTLMPDQRKYLTFNLRQGGDMAGQMANAMPGVGGDADHPDLSTMKVTPTGRTETIAGIACTHYLFDQPDDGEPPMDICAAAGMGFLGTAGGPGSMMPSTIALLDTKNPDLARLARQGFFPLSMRMTGGDEGFAWVVTQVDRRRPDPALFAPPAGYTKFEIPGMPRSRP